MSNLYNIFYDAYAELFYQAEWLTNDFIKSLAILTIFLTIILVVWAFSKIFKIITNNIGG
ncbi:MAG: hypothetical protein AB7V16_13630 [Vulcanibacillus sp.]